MTSDQTDYAIHHIEGALAVTRAGLAECNDADETLKMNEIALECVLKDYRKRHQNALELEARGDAA